MLEQFWLFHCGFIRVPRPAFVAGGALDFPRLPFLAGLAYHSEKGPVLIDAPFGREGYSNLGALIGALVKTAGLRFEEDWSVAARVEQLGYRPTEIEHICMTHLHSDHTGGIKELPNATIHVCRTEWEHAVELEGLSAVTNGYQPEDFRALEDRMDLFDEPDRINGASDGIDVFGDGSVVAVGLPGHSIGHVGYRLQFEDGGAILHAGDAGFSVCHIVDRKALGYFPRRMAYSTDEANESLRLLRTHYEEHSDQRIVTSHDFELAEACLDGPVPLHEQGEVQRR